MMTVLFILAAAGVIALQVMVCLKSQRLLIRILPAVALALVQVVLWMAFLFSADSMELAVATVVYSLLLVGLLMADFLGWGIYLIVKIVQKRKEKIVV